MRKKNCPQQTASGDSVVGHYEGGFLPAFPELPDTRVLASETGVPEKNLEPGNLPQMGVSETPESEEAE